MSGRILAFLMIFLTINGCKKEEDMNIPPLGISIPEEAIGLYQWVGTVGYLYSSNHFAPDRGRHYSYSTSYPEPSTVKYLLIEQNGIITQYSTSGIENYTANNIWNVDSEDPMVIGTDAGLRFTLAPSEGFLTRHLTVSGEYGASFPFIENWKKIGYNEIPETFEDINPINPSCSGTSDLTGIYQGNLEYLSYDLDSTETTFTDTLISTTVTEEGLSCKIMFDGVISDQTLYLSETNTVYLNWPYEKLTVTPDSLYYYHHEHFFKLSTSPSEPSRFITKTLLFSGQRIN